MRVLITGSAGFAGSHLVDHILEKTDWEIVGLDSFKHRGCPKRVQNSKRYTMLTSDLSAPISYRVIQDLGNIDYLVNMASESHVDRSIVDPVTFVQNNVNLALYVLELAKILNVKKFIQISTDEVYGAAPEGMKHVEWSTILPSNPYAASKAAQEAIAISYWRTYGIPLFITNTMNLFGERQDKEKFIPMLISKIYNDETVTIHGTSQYIGKRHYLHARNHADAILHLLQNISVQKYQDNPDKIIMPHRFHVVGDIELDNLELAKRVAKLLNKPLKYDLVDFHHARPGHDRRYALNADKIKDTGWRQPMNFDQCLYKTIEWTLENKIWLS